MDARATRKVQDTPSLPLRFSCTHLRLSTGLDNPKTRCTTLRQVHVTKALLYLHHSSGEFCQVANMEDYQRNQATECKSPLLSEPISFHYWHIISQCLLPVGDCRGQGC